MYRGDSQCHKILSKRLYDVKDFPKVILFFNKRDIHNKGWLY